MSGFASNHDDFAEFDAGAVWITNRLDPSSAQHAKFMAQLTSVATQLTLQLGALPDELQGMITAEILGPSPIDSGGEFSRRASRINCPDTPNTSVKTLPIFTLACSRTF